ncbi:MAG: acetolactate synthase large subunit [Candidatus Hydrogenedentota bacterium]
MTGAESLLQSALKSGVATCFANPGTTEMDFVKALDNTPEVKTVLALFEGVCTGMADGFGRMTDAPAMTLLHLGVGLGNGIANLHNARRAQSPVVNLVGDHPVDHVKYDAPLTSDIATMAAPVSNVVHTSESADTVGEDISRLISQASTMPGNVTTLITPADTMRDETTVVHEPTPIPDAPALDSDVLKNALGALENPGATTAIIINGRALRKEGLEIASRIEQKTGCTIFSSCFPARMDRGAGIPAIKRLPYFPEMVQERIAPFNTLILIGAYTHPVSFFKYEGIPSDLVHEGCAVINLAQREHDTVDALRSLEEGCNAASLTPICQELLIPDAPTGSINRKSIGPAIARALPENAIISDTSGSSGAPIYYNTQSAHPHSSLFLTGGGIGMGPPVAAGAAVACPDRPVIALQSDGGGLYTVQALWTQARESLNVTTIIFANRKYQILQTELARAGIENPGPVATSLTDLSNPDISWCKLAEGFGVPAYQPQNIEEFQKNLTNSINNQGPHLIELII